MDTGTSRIDSIDLEGQISVDSTDTARLRGRARALRSLASEVEPFLAPTYRRRASELELQLWILEVRSGHAPDEPPLAA